MDKPKCIHARVCKIYATISHCDRYAAIHTNFSVIMLQESQMNGEQCIDGKHLRQLRLFFRTKNHFLTRKFVSTAELYVFSGTMSTISKEDPFVYKIKMVVRRFLAGKKQISHLRVKFSESLQWLYYIPRWSAPAFSYYFFYAIEKLVGVVS